MSSAIWAADYYWIGGASGFWDEPSNWSFTENGEAVNSYPNTSLSNVFFPSEETTSIVLRKEITTGSIESKCESLTLSATNTNNGPIKINSSINAKDLFFQCNLTCDTASEITCNNLIFLSKTILNVNKNLTLNAYVLFNGSKIAGRGKLFVTDDFVINSNSALSIESETTINGSFVSYGADISVSQDITIKKDLVLYGKNYNAVELQSNTPDINIYKNGNFDKQILPDGSSLPLTGTKGNLCIKTASSRKITTFKNFYANGISIDPANLGSITLDTNKNTKTFAKIYNSNLLNLNITRITSGKDNLVIPLENCTFTEKSYYESDDFKIKNAYTTSDDTICIEFNREIKNLDGCFSKNVSQLYYSEGSFVSVYIDEACTTLLPENDTTIKTVYIKSSAKWNTDATGKTFGHELSTDKSGNHQTAIPYICFNRGSNLAEFITDLYGKPLKHYPESAPFDETKDNCGPSLVSVKTGQECHTIENQKPYDAHNFIEFRYSEPVNLGSKDFLPAYDSKGNPTVKDNLKVTDEIGVISKKSNGELNIAGICKIQSGIIETYSKGKENKYVNTLYRDNPFAIKLSIAGLQENSKWTGYIENAVTPSGYVNVDSEHSFTKPTTYTKVGYITDNVGNFQNTIHGNTLKVDSTVNGIYSKWDTSAPVFATFTHQKGSYEAAGVTSGTGSTIDSVEFHLFDNSSMENAVWISELGWCKNSTLPYKLYNSNTQCMDIFGGARPFAASNSTAGGIRTSTIEDNISAFTFSTGSANNLNFTKLSDSKISATLFTGSANNGINEIDAKDSLYFGLELKEKNISVSETITVSYNDSNSFITDLAGNRLRSNPSIKTTDRTPPAFNTILAPVGGNEVFISFTKKIKSENIAANVKKCFEIVKNKNNSMELSDLTIESVEEVKKETDFTCIKLRLNRKLTLNDIKTTYIRVKKVSPSTDKFTNIENCYVTPITDKNNNCIQMLSAHSISDFAINTVKPIYAYKTNLSAQDLDFASQDKNKSFTVRNWDKNQKYSNSLPANEAVSIVTDWYNSKTEVEKAKIILSNNPVSDSLFTKFNKDFSTDLRVWIPKITETQNRSFTAYSQEENTNFIAVDSQKSEKLANEQLLFECTENIVSDWNPGNTVSFLFELPAENFCICPVYNSLTNTYDFETHKVPLFALRLTNSSDLTSLDLWSFNLKKSIEQTGGVSILNNVINVSKGDVTVVRVNLPTDVKKLNVIVMTMDGNIIKYLNHGETKAGEYNFTWNGKNEKGNTVARGIYFIRIKCDNIDETRKVMCIK